MNKLAAKTTLRDAFLWFAASSFLIFLTKVLLDWHEVTGKEVTIPYLIAIAFMFLVVFFVILGLLSLNNWRKLKSRM